MHWRRAGSTRRTQSAGARGSLRAAPRAGPRARHRMRWCGTLSSEERRPVVVEVAESGVHVDGTCRDPERPVAVDSASRGAGAQAGKAGWSARIRSPDRAREARDENGRDERKRSSPTRHGAGRDASRSAVCYNRLNRDACSTSTPPLWPRPDDGPQGPLDTGAGGSGCPPGPAAKVSGEIGSCWPTPGLVQSHTPSGKAACSRASWASLKVTGA